jgi:hypothetical protein
MSKPTIADKATAWWNESPSESWTKTKADVLATWQKVADGSNAIGEQITEKALAFGHGARKHYDKLEVWEADLEDKLKADWTQAGHDVEASWDKVSAAVQHGWKHTAVNTKSMAAKVESATASVVSSMATAVAKAATAVAKSADAHK